MKTISILNLKGGVAKTFTAANMRMSFTGEVIRCC